MLTPQEVNSKTFPKAVVGGYAMAAVDEFLDALTEDYGSLYKENAGLKAKIKGLMDQIEEYRQVEDAMRSTLLAAQKMAKEIVAEAESKRDAIAAEAESRKSSLVADAESSASTRRAQIRELMAQEEQALAEKKSQVAAEMAAEEQKLEKARRAVSKFMQVSRLNCEEQLKILDRLEEWMPEPVEAPAAPAEEPAEPQAEEIPQPVESETPEMEEEPTDRLEEDHLSAEGEEEERELELDQAFFTSPLPTMEDLKNIPVEEAADVSVWDDLPEDATRVINLDELKFGRNYKRDK